MNPTFRGRDLLQWAGRAEELAREVERLRDVGGQLALELHKMTSERDRAVTLLDATKRREGKLTAARGALEQVRTVADDLERHAAGIEVSPESSRRFGPDEYIDGRVYGYREAARRIRLALDPDDPDIRIFTLTDSDVIDVDGQRWQVRAGFLCEVPDGQEPWTWKDMDGGDEEGASDG